MSTKVSAAYDALQASVTVGFANASPASDANASPASARVTDDGRTLRKAREKGSHECAERVAREKEREQKEGGNGEDVPAWRAPRIRVGDGASACESAYAAACVASASPVSSRVLKQLKQRRADVSSANLGRAGAMAIAAGVAANAVTESLDVSRNRIDDEGIRALCVAATRATVLRALNFSENKMSKAIAPACAVALKRLKALNFAACGVDDAAASALFAILRERDCALEKLNVSKNKITNASGRAIGDALEANSTLRVFDVSWNVVGAEACAEISRGLKANDTLEYLSLAWNGFGDEGGKCIGDSLGVNRSLRELDLSRCRLGGDACMVISEGLRTNDVLTTLRLDHNACGEDGGRHLMAMLMHNDVLTTLTLEGASFVDVPMRKRRTQAKQGATFNPHNPDGRYALNLEDTSDRAIASQLCHLESENPGSMTSAKLTTSEKEKKKGAPVKTKTVDVLEALKREGLDGVARRGSVEIQFSMSAAGLARQPKPIEPEDLDNLVRQLRNNRLSDFERLLRLKMFCGSYYFLVAHAAKLLQTFVLEGSDRLQAAAVCYARLLDAEHSEKMFTSRFEFERLRKMLGSYAHFRAANPTGRYELNLAVDIDRTIASTMVDIAAFEGRRRTWRNVRLNRAKGSNLMRSGVPTSLATCMPNAGTLEFDYASSIRVPEDAPKIEDNDLHDMLVEKGVLVSQTPGTDVPWCAVDSAEALHALRECSVRVNVSARQYARVCNAFRVGADRVEAYVTLFSRVIDATNIPRVIGSMSCFEQSYFGLRVGWRNILGDDPQAFTMHYRLDLSCDEQASVAKHLVTSAVREYKDGQVIRNVTINGRRLARDPVEDDALWSVLTAESFTPILEFDYFGADVWGVVDRELGVKDIPSEKSAREATLKRLATRLAFIRASTLHVDWLTHATDETSAAAARDDRVLHRRAWSDSMRAIVRAEVAHVSAASSPLRVIFDSLDADGGGTLSLHEFREGAARILGRPIPRAVIEPYFSAEHFDGLRHEGVLTWDIFEKVCVENFTAGTGTSAKRVADGARIET